MRLQEADCLAPTLVAGMQTGAQPTAQKTDLPTEASSLGRIVVSLDRECLGGKNRGF